MPAETRLEIRPDQMTPIVESVFATMMGLDVAPCGGSWSPGPRLLTSAVHLYGECNGVVLVECDWGPARRLAERFISLNWPDADIAEPPDDVVRDFLGEVANMIGGNLKCILTRGMRISTPSVVDGGDYCLRIRGGAVIERLAFQCAEGTVRITLLAAEPDSE